MAQVKIYGRRDVWQDRRGSLSDAVHRAIVGTWGLPPEKRFHRFFLLDADDLVAPRSKDYLVIEILCFTGRSREARRALISAFYDDVAPTLGWPPTTSRSSSSRAPRRTGASVGCPGTSSRSTTAWTSEPRAAGT